MSSPSTEVAGEAPSGVQQIPKVSAWNVRHWTTAQLTRSLRVANMCNGAVLIATGILCFLVASVQISFATITVSAYVVFFGLMLSCLECNMTACELTREGRERRGGLRAWGWQAARAAARAPPLPCPPSHTHT